MSSSASPTASRPTGRPLTTALGWRLPSWLLDYGPIVFILIEGLAAIRFQSRVSGISSPSYGDSVSAGGIISRFVAVGLAVAVGLWLRARADYVTGLHERAERLEREQELMAQTSVAEERLRIARELHDVVAHNVSLMVVQAQALAATGGGADQQQTALTGMADLGREALSEMHRMLGVLRVQNAGAPEREPNPGVRDLERLIARTREAGLDASLLDEVEKTCDAAAIVDRGRLIAQGPIDTLLGGERRELDVGCEDSHAALDLLDGHPSVAAARETEDGLRIVLAGANGVADINSRLVGAGISVFRLEPVRESLEHRFLEITSRVGAPS